MAGDNAARLAVLIDADNAQPSIVEGLLAEVAKYGTAHVKRAYGKRYLDWPLDDPAGKGVEDVRPVRDEVERRVRALLDELGVAART